MFSIQFNDSAAELTIKWNDNHRSVHSLNWLRERSFDYANRREHLDSFYRPKKTLWNKDGYNQVLDRYKFEDLIHENEGKWLKYKKFIIRSQIVAHNSYHTFTTINCIEEAIYTQTYTWNLKNHSLSALWGLEISFFFFEGDFNCKHTKT